MPTSLIRRFVGITLALSAVIVPPCEASQVKVVAIPDADILAVVHDNKKKEQVRLYGIDAPEKQQAYGKNAQEFLASFVGGQQVDIEHKAVVRKGTVSGIVSIGGQNINELMVQTGHAWVDRQACQEKFCADWIKMEDAARETRQGLWSEPASIPPWEFRQAKGQKPASRAKEGNRQQK